MIFPDGGPAGMVRDRLFYIYRKDADASYRRAGGFLRRKYPMLRGFPPPYIQRAGCIYFTVLKKILKTP